MGHRNVLGALQGISAAFQLAFICFKGFLGGSRNVSKGLMMVIRWFSEVFLRVSGKENSFKTELF